MNIEIKVDYIKPNTPILIVQTIGEYQQILAEDKIGWTVLLEPQLLTEPNAL